MLQAKKIEQKSKEAKAKAASGGGKAKKKKWSKGKQKDKANNAVVFDQATYDKLFQEIPHQRYITVATVSDRLKVNGSLARKALSELEKQGVIRPVQKHSSCLIYTRAIKPEATEEEKEEKEE